MEQKLQITYFKPERQGVFPRKNGCGFVVEISNNIDASECGVILYDKKDKALKIPFSKQGKRGTLYGVQIEGNELEKYRYRYYEGETVFTDSYARGINGLETWGDFKEQKRETFGRILFDDFDWEEDEPLKIPYKDTIIYGLNVRSFTMHKSSGVKHKGTFEGIIEKIPYLTNLGITAVELMPAYEYEECMALPGPAKTMEEALQKCTVEVNEKQKVNCWGFQEGYYFAPKASYAVEKPELSFKKMVKALHQNGIEVIMHFYFPPGRKQTYILDILKYWVMEYHIDGFRLSGFQIPFVLIAQEPLLKETKIRSDYFPVEEIYGGKPPLCRNLAANNGNFRNDMRRFLKGDENLINQVVFYQKNNPVSNAVVNFLADYDGFSLYDCVSYERKHNEENGEENRDGSEYNFSWNCGVEGESRKKSVLELRGKQLKNALAMLFLSQGVPYLFAGDEFANTRFGNNNAYCQDNEIGWIKWKENRFTKELLSFTQELIAIRKKHPILHLECECHMMDPISCGYPDISYHGMEAWRPDLSYISRMIGIMLYGKHVPGKEDDSFYIAYNMHWQEHKLALPKLSKGMKWVKILETDHITESNDKSKEENKILTKGRSIALYCSAKDENYKEKTKSKNNNRKDGMKNERLETL